MVAQSNNNFTLLINETSKENDDWDREMASGRDWRGSPAVNFTLTTGTVNAEKYFSFSIKFYFILEKRENSTKYPWALGWTLFFDFQIFFGIPPRIVSLGEEIVCAKFEID